MKVTERREDTETERERERDGETMRGLVLVRNVKRCGLSHIRACVRKRVEKNSNENIAVILLC